MSRRRGAVTRSQKNTSQTDPDVPDESTENIINDVVRYIILKADENSCYTRSEMNKNVIHKRGQCLDSVIQQAIKVLEDVYGYELIEYNAVNMKETFYFLRSMLPPLDDSSEEEEECVSNDETDSDISIKAQKILSLFILSHIFMTNAPVSDKSLYGFLMSLDIDVEVKHPFFGNVKEYIKTLTRQHYLHCEFDNKTKKQAFQWGFRAEIEVSKMEVLQFVCKMYGNKQPEDFTEQYRVAQNQVRGKKTRM
ncbi:hypothetical protein GWI33_006199 [Rhynchophorus ferrugineus]|uniref:MAGE domain-containing protein n=1 Tax=Rhynchophorus ferrugineus TaxID=354439 RepID=A0A834IV14_RHYFE|nr:hypothetical protein GWI33_006199 [Rhynchophorus ferrugineus]